MGAQWKSSSEVQVWMDLGHRVLAVLLGGRYSMVSLEKKLGIVPLLGRQYCC